MRGSLLLFLFRPQSGCFIVTKLKWENNSVASYSVARIFLRIVFKIPLYWLPPPPFQIWTLLLYSIFFIISLTTLRCILKACRNEFELRAPMFALWWEEGRKAWRCPRGHSRLTFFLKFGYVLMPFVAFRSPLRSAFSWQFRSIFECDGHQNATGLSVPEIELLVELSIAFDFC